MHSRNIAQAVADYDIANRVVADNVLAGCEFVRSARLVDYDLRGLVAKRVNVFGQFELELFGRGRCNLNRFSLRAPDEGRLGDVDRGFERYRIEDICFFQVILGFLERRISVACARFFCRLTPSLIFTL